MTFAAEDRTADFWLKWHLVALTAVVANYFETLRRILGRRGLLRTTFGASLRRHHITLIEHFLVLFCEHKNVLTLNTRNFNVRHYLSSSEILS
jgi:hypothetical protein